MIFGLYYGNDNFQMVSEFIAIINQTEAFILKNNPEEVVLQIPST